MNKTVIYMMGTSYSGSTFFSSALSVHPQIETAGQLHQWILLKNINAVCSCGKPFKECEFWTRVWGAWEERTKSTLDDFSKLLDKYEHFRHFSSVRADKAANESFRRYFFYNQTLFDVVSEVSGRPVVVDVSKYPVRGLALAKDPEKDVRFIHLVRNGPSYLSSVIKHSVNPKSRHYGHSKTFLYFRATRDWILINLQADRVNRISGRPSIRVRYEDFISQPQKTFAEIDQRLGTDLDLEKTGHYLANDGPVSFRHSSGNKVQYDGAAPIRTSDSWKKLIEPKAYFIFNGLAGWLAKRYGYPLLRPD